MTEPLPAKKAPNPFRAATRLYPSSAASVSAHPIPSPSGSRLGLGHLAGLDADFLGYTTELAQRYGDCVYYRVGLVPTYQFTHPDQIQEVLVTKSKSFRKTDRLRRVLGRALGNSLLLNEGESWARQRALLQPAFHPQRLLDYAEPIVRRTNEFLDRHVDQEIDIVAALSQLTLVTTAEALFGVDLTNVAEHFVREVATLQDLTYPDFTADKISPQATLRLQHPRMAQSIDFLRSVIDEIVDGRRSGSRSRKTSSGVETPRTLATSATSRMDSQHARDEVTIMLAGGAGTTATALTWATYLLARHPDAQHRIFAEVDRVTGRHLPKGEQVSQFEFTQMALNEAMRLFPPAYTTSRQATQPVEIGGHRLATGSQVHLIPYITHRDSRWFDAPDEFRPDRFSATAKRTFPRFAFFPFGAGPRACIGGGLAMLTGTLVLTTISRRCKLELAMIQGEPQLAPKISLHPKGGLRLRLTPRTSLKP